MIRMLVSGALVLFFLALLLFSSGVLQLLLQLFTFVVLTLLMVVILLSLTGKSTPIITRYALLMGAEDSAEERSYTRKVTWFWFGFLVLLFGLKLSAFTGGLTNTTGGVELMFYLGSGVLFVGEFYLRPLFLPAHKGSSFWRFILQLGQVSPKEIWQFDSKKELP